MKTLVNFLFEAQYNFKIDKSEKAKITDYKNQLSRFFNEFNRLEMVKNKVEPKLPFIVIK